MPLPDISGILSGVQPGDRVVFTPRSADIWPWTVRARDERFIVATTQRPFRPKGELLYTVVDLTGWQDIQRNGQGRGVVRSSLDILGGGWGDGSYDDEACAEILAALVSGEWGLSHRRVLSVRDVEVAAAAATSREQA